MRWRSRRRQDVGGRKEVRGEYREKELKGREVMRTVKLEGGRVLKRKIGEVRQKSRKNRRWKTVRVMGVKRN